ncbi:MAG: hypothetical protein JWS12_325 [Candidatus Saccharibacteria bacterium]|nr:hypothetical protein [Candidatus Saccharibacteria bacterium]
MNPNKMRATAVGIGISLAAIGAGAGRLAAENYGPTDQQVTDCAQTLEPHLTHSDGNTPECQPFVGEGIVSLGKIATKVPGQGGYAVTFQEAFIRPGKEDFLVMQKSFDRQDRKKRETHWSLEGGALGLALGGLAAKVIKLKNKLAA